MAPQYYPPKNLSLLQSALLIDKFADKKDFSAAVLELASKGYLEIYNNANSAESPYVKLLKKSDDSLKDDQRYIMDELLFKNGEKYEFDKPDAKKASEVTKPLWTASP